MLDRYGHGRTAADPRAVARARTCATGHDDRRWCRRSPRSSATSTSQVRQYGSLRRVPAGGGAERSQRHVSGRRGDPASRRKDRTVDVRRDATRQLLQAYRSELDGATRFIPTWVKVAVAIALGLGTMVGWKRIVVTVGEKIGKSHLTYAQGASAELVAAVDHRRRRHLRACRCRRRTCCRPASPAPWRRTDRACRWRTVRNLALAWVLTLPAAILLSGSLFWLFIKVF